VSINILALPIRGTDTYPTLGTGKSSSKAHWEEICWFSGEYLKKTLDDCSPEIQHQYEKYDGFKRYLLSNKAILGIYVNFQGVYLKIKPFGWYKGGYAPPKKADPSPLNAFF